MKDGHGTIGPVHADTSSSEQELQSEETAACFGDGGVGISKGPDL